MGEEVQKNIGEPETKIQEAKQQNRLVRLSVHDENAQVTEPTSLEDIANIFWNNSKELPATFVSRNGKQERSTTTLMPESPFIIPKGMNVKLFTRQKGREDFQKMPFGKEGKTYEMHNVNLALLSSQLEEVILIDLASQESISLLPSSYVTECKLAANETHNQCTKLAQKINPKHINTIREAEAKEILVELDDIEKLFLQVLGHEPLAFIKDFLLKNPTAKEREIKEEIHKMEGVVVNHDLQFFEEKKDPDELISSEKNNTGRNDFLKSILYEFLKSINFSKHQNDPRLKMILSFDIFKEMYVFIDNDVNIDVFFNQIITPDNLGENFASNALKNFKQGGAGDESNAVHFLLEIAKEISNKFIQNIHRGAMNEEESMQKVKEDYSTKIIFFYDLMDDFVDNKDFLKNPQEYKDLLLFIVDQDEFLQKLPYIYNYLASQKEAPEYSPPQNYRDLQEYLENATAEEPLSWNDLLDSFLRKKDEMGINATIMILNELFQNDNGKTVFFDGLVANASFFGLSDSDLKALAKEIRDIQSETNDLSSFSTFVFPRDQGVTPVPVSKAIFSNFIKAIINEEWRSTEYSKSNTAQLDFTKDFFQRHNIEILY